MPGPGLLAVGAAGAALLLVALLDVFMTIFNYDGLTFLAPPFHRVMWGLLRRGTAWLPDRPRHAALSLGSAAMLPATLALWLTLEISAFAMMFLPGMAAGSFALTNGVGSDIGDAYYLSAGAISSLTFGDVVARNGLYRALVDVETIIGLSTFTLALTYVLTAFGALSSLNRLHARVRRNTIEPSRPETVVARHFQAGQADELPGLLSALVDDLEDYDQGLRRYPVVFYFHTRRLDRSTPCIFIALGQLIELLRWGLPADHPMAKDPLLLALLDGYRTTVTRLQQNFIGPEAPDEPEPVSRERFENRDLDDRDTAEFVDLRRRASEAAHIPAADYHETAADSYDQYREWLTFHHRNRVFLDHLSEVLGYATPSR
jgi:hypothetical protein